MLLRLGVGGGFLVLIFRAISVDEIVRTLASIDLVLAAAVCAVAWADRALMAYKWNLLLRARNVRVPHAEAIRLFFVGSLLGTVTPGAIGADAYRVAALSRFKQHGIVISTVILERFVGLAVISLFAAAGIFVVAREMGLDSTGLIWMVFAGAALATAAIVLSLWSEFVEGIARRIPFIKGTRMAVILRDFYRAYAEIRRHPGVLIWFTLLTALELLAIVFMTFLAARAIHVEVSFGYFVSIVPLIAVLVRLPISFHGIGVFEGALAYFLALRGFHAAQGVSIALVMRIVEVVAIFLPAVVMLWAGPIRVAGGTDDTD